MAETQTDAETVTREITIDAPIEDCLGDGLDRRRSRPLARTRRATAGSWSRRPSRPAASAGGGGTSRDNEPARYVDVRVVAVPDGGTRVTVTETQPAIVPVAQLAASFELTYAA